MKALLMVSVAASAATLMTAACGGSDAPSRSMATSCGDGGCMKPDACADGGCTSHAVCPAGLQPTFRSIRAKVLSVSCGTSGNACHSTAGSIDSGQLNLADDPYAELLGADGMGGPASNIAGSVRNLKRVVPGDPDHSLLAIKLRTKRSDDPDYGSGMPLTSPGSVCPATLETIRTWIANGAADN